jgi:predicted dienelactone hydrolase
MKPGSLRTLRRISLLVLLLALAACAPASTATPQPAPTSPPPTEPVPLPLSEPGPYAVGVTEFSAQDASRESREVGIRVWYPALRPEGSSGSLPIHDADPDRTGAPYPLIVSSAKHATIFAPYVVAYGFAWAGVTRIDTYALWNAEMIDQPLDILFALDQVASHPPRGLEGVIDAERAGATGYSFDGYNALALSGARVDPDFYLAQCANADATAEAVLSISSNRYQCALAGDWEAFAAHAGPAITASEDGLWQPLTDPRVRAVLPMAGEGWLLFGDRGLAAVDRPALILVATQDELYPENALIFEHLGMPDKALISFVGLDHMMVYDLRMDARMAHFTVAFFGYYLQGRQDLARYFSKEFVAQYGDLAWGAVAGP